MWLTGTVIVRSQCVYGPGRIGEPHWSGFVGHVPRIATINESMPAGETRFAWSPPHDRLRKRAIAFVMFESSGLVWVLMDHLVSQIGPSRPCGYCAEQANKFALGAISPALYVRENRTRADVSRRLTAAHFSIWLANMRRPVCLCVRPRPDLVAVKKSPWSPSPYGRRY
ncbi:hypothetical protein EVAR_19076_1 [Eumeta japonica]|uniref:Uncharacterized protein n=1 Tax=Eumeta variegata TaxID=151549 RepID=A0A4C1UP58_EUMVA|nr:hypothetical protein EVAR_19076_1 [Eumeta japonica]